MRHSDGSVALKQMLRRRRENERSINRRYLAATTLTAQSYRAIAEGAQTQTTGKHFLTRTNTNTGAGSSSAIEELPEIRTQKNMSATSQSVNVMNQTLTELPSFSRKVK